MIFPSRKIIFLTRLTVVSAAMLQLSFIASAENSVNVIERIEKNSKGEISIEIPQNILNMILKQSSKKDANSGLKSGVNKLSGFRIQVFSDGRNQSTLEARAKARGSAILAKLPKYRGQVYTYSSSPNWYTRVGNFRTNAEANAALTEMKRAFPNFASEMRIVKCQIVVIK